MSKVRPEKAATVKEVKSRVKATSTAVVTEYRGMTVAQISSLRRQLRTLDADFKVYKNTLVLRAIAGSSVESLSEFLQGPTAISFIDGDISAVAKALRDFARETPTLIVKGGVVDGKALTTKDLVALADLPSRDVLLAQFAGLLASPLRTMAGLLKAVSQNFAYGLAALLESKGGAPTPDVVEPVVETEPEVAAVDAEYTEVEIAEVDAGVTEPDVAELDAAEPEAAETEAAEAEVAEAEVAEAEVAEVAVEEAAVEEAAVEEAAVEEAADAPEAPASAGADATDEAEIDTPEAPVEDAASESSE
jgi:large subunit ribosomal protein L10